MEPERKLHVVEKEEPKVQAVGIGSKYLAGEGGWEWVPFPGLEELGVEVQCRHHNFAPFQKWREQIARKFKKRNEATTTDMQVWKATTPGGYAEHLVGAWRTPIRDEDGNNTGEWIAGAPWGLSWTTTTQRVPVIKGKGAVMQAVEFVFDVDDDGYLRPTEPNRAALFAVFGTLFDDFAAICRDDEIFAVPDEEAIRGN